MRFRRNVDEELRLAEREAATGDPQAIARYVRLRLRRGEQVTAWDLQAVEQDPRERLRYLIAAREELPGYSDIELKHRSALGEVNLRAMAALRSLAPRIRRSRRGDVAGLEALEKSGGSVKGAAEILGVNRNTVAVAAKRCAIQLEPPPIRERISDDEIRKAMREADDSVKKASALLGISMNSLWREIERRDMEGEFNLRRKAT